MDLSTPSPENIHFLIEAIKEKLRMVNADAMKSEHFGPDCYEDLVYLYELVNKRSAFSPSEMQAIVAELGSLRK
ncbi:MAG: DUF1128 domain-containing protein [Kurthia sp.]|nr:DUF1128 domain-containing protein [Candidatus Kurthia equi]